MTPLTPDAAVARLRSRFASFSFTHAHFAADEYIKIADLIADLQAQNAALVRERDRLTICLATANKNHEQFERLWYLAKDENEKLEQELAEARAGDALDKIGIPQNALPILKGLLKAL